MTEQAIVRTNGGSAMIMSQDPEKVASRLKLMIVNGKRLQDQEALALAQYAIGTGLNPFLNECYYLPGIGPGPGIAGWRRKAQEQLDYEAKRADLPIAQVWASARPATPDEANFDPDKDIAYFVTIHDSISRTLWEKRILSHYIDLVKNGLKDNAWELARELAGPEPEWSGVGVVKSNENFGSAEKFDRHERAKKRGEKLAIRKRFNLNLPAPVVWEEYDIIEADVSFVDAEPRPTKTVMAELGFDEPEPETPAIEYPPELSVVTNSKGQPYVTLDTEDLSYMLNSIIKELAKPDLPEDKKADLSMKHDAIKDIFKLRNNR